MPLPPLPVFLIQVQNPYMEFGLIISNIMKGEVLFHLRNPPGWVGTIKFMHVNFGHLIPRRWRTLRGAIGLSMFIVRRVKFFWVWLNILTPKELHQFVDLLVKGYGKFIAEGSHVVFNLLFQVGHSILQDFLGLRESGRNGEGLGSNGGVGMEKMGLKMIGTWLIRKKRGIQWDRSQERHPRGGWVCRKKRLKMEGCHCD
jgi:hypothetical protein